MAPEGDRRVLASISESLEVRLRDDRVFGRLRPTGRRRYVLEASVLITY